LLGKAKEIQKQRTSASMSWQGMGAKREMTIVERACNSDEGDHVCMKAAGSYLAPYLKFP
jgi:hypothetical protein